MISFYTIAGELNLNNNDILFRGVTKQSSDYSCGAAALSTLITGLIENSHVTEGNIMEEINLLSKHRGREGYSLLDLMNASKKFGYYAEWRKISTSELTKINVPTILLIGLNSEFPHFVVLKGIKNGEAFLADSIRGNIRVPYDNLIKEGINEKYDKWFVMAIEPSANKPKGSTIYLSEKENDRLNTHFTVEQSNAITLATLSKRKQWIFDYSIIASSGTNKRYNIESKTFSHILNARYGITDDIELGGRIQHSDNIIDFNHSDNKLSVNDSNKQYAIYANYRFKLADSSKTNFIAGLDTSYMGDNMFNGDFSIIGYQNTESAQIILGSSINKTFNNNGLLKASLPEYSYSGFIGASKPFGDRYLASVGFAVNDGKNKKGVEKFDQSYMGSAGLTYIINKKYQISPLFTYSFGNNSEIFSLGMSIAYIGSW